MKDTLIFGGTIHAPDARALYDMLEPTTAEMFGLSKGADMYDLIKNLKALNFLKEPQATDDIFEAVLC